MAITPVYFLGLELKHLAATVNASECWRALVEQPDANYATLMALATAGTADEANGLAAIKKGVVEGDSVTYPHCQVCHLPDGDSENMDNSSLVGENPMLIQIEHTIPTTYDSDIADAQEYWREVVARIVSEMVQAKASDSAGLIDWNRVGISQGLEPPDDRSNGRRMGIARILVYAHREVS